MSKRVFKCLVHIITAFQLTLSNCNYFKGLIIKLISPLHGLLNRALFDWPLAKQINFQFCFNQIHFSCKCIPTSPKVEISLHHFVPFYNQEKFHNLYFFHSVFTFHV